MKIRYKRLFLFFPVVLILSGIGYSEKDEETLPVKVTIPPFFNLHLTSTAQKLNFENTITSEFSIRPGSIYYGNLAIDTSIQNQNHFQTFTHIEMINNSRPFALTIRLYPSEGKKYILDLKNKENENALMFKTIKTEKTRFHKNITNLGQWTPVPSSGIISLYDSHGEVVSDSFAVIFSIDTIKKETASDEYGGGIMWSLDSGL